MDHGDACALPLKRSLTEPVLRQRQFVAACGLVAVGSIVTLPTQSTRRVS